MSEDSASSHSSISSTTASDSDESDRLPSHSSISSTTASDSDDVAPGPAAHAAAGTTIMGPAEAVLDVLHAYAVVVYCEGLALVEGEWNLAKKPWLRWNERDPVRPRPEGLVRGNYIPVVLGLLQTIVMLISFYLVPPSLLRSSQDEARNLSAQERQVRFALE